MIGNASKLLRHPDRLADLWSGTPVVPVTMELHLTNRCNQACQYCHIKHSACDLFAVRDIIRQAEDLSVCGIVLGGGGEPLLGQMSEVMHSTIPMGLITNGSVETDASVFNRFGWVRFSVDSCVPSTYMAIRGADMPGCLIGNISAAARITTTGVQMVIGKENINDVPIMAAWSLGLGAHYLHVRPDDYGGEYWPPEEHLKANYGFPVIARTEKLAYGPVKVCYAGHFGMTITADGRCWVCACDRPRFCVGDLNHQTLSDVVYSDHRRDVLAALDPSGCPVRCRGAAINQAIAESEKHCQWL